MATAMRRHGPRRPDDAVPFGIRVAAAFAWRLLLLAAAVAVLAHVAATLRLVVVPAVLAVFLAVLLDPLKRRLERTPLPSGAAAAAAMVVFLLVIGGTFALLAPAVVDELDTLQADVEEGARQVLEWAGEGPLNTTDAQIEDVIAGATGRLEDNAGAVSSGVLSGAALVAEVIAGLLLAVILTFFFLKDGGRLWQWVLRRAGQDRRAGMEAIGERIWTTLGLYLRGVLIVAAFDAVFIGLALVLVGVPLALPLTVITFIAAFVPIVGAIVAGAAATLVALVSGGLDEALIVLAAVIVIQQLESQLLSPIVIGRAVALHPGVVLVAVTAGAVTFGVIGAAIAAPIAAVIKAATTVLATGNGEVAPPANEAEQKTTSKPA